MLQQRECCSGWRMARKCSKNGVSGLSIPSPVPLGLGLQHGLQGRALRAASSDSSNGAMADATSVPESFCIIEGRDAVKDFANMPIDEIRVNIASRRDKIFLLMEELRRLRIQQRLKVSRNAGHPCVCRCVETHQTSNRHMACDIRLGGKRSESGGTCTEV
eukprot:GHUV01028377.1.p1 GENE.GHUV01028377.1~~GHUV01028377.1.p1  ORF type:complete len:161 (+),score=14.98 GHUV01028377.1:253-735(+)